MKFGVYWICISFGTVVDWYFCAYCVYTPNQYMSFYTIHTVWIRITLKRKKRIRISMKTHEHNSPWTLKNVLITLGGKEFTWHSYSPSSLLLAAAIFNRQLFGYWNSTLNRTSPLYVCIPTVSNCNLSSLGSRFTHDTCKWKVCFKFSDQFFVSNNVYRFVLQQTNSTI